MVHSSNLIYWLAFGTPCLLNSSEWFEDSRSNTIDLPALIMGNVTLFSYLYPTSVEEPSNLTSYLKRFVPSLF